MTALCALAPGHIMCSEQQVRENRYVHMRMIVFPNQASPSSDTSVQHEVSDYESRLRPCALAGGGFNGIKRWPGEPQSWRPPPTLPGHLINIEHFCVTIKLYYIFLSIYLNVLNANFENVIWTLYTSEYDKYLWWAVSFKSFWNQTISTLGWVRFSGIDKNFSKDGCDEKRKTPSIFDFFLIFQ